MKKGAIIKATIDNNAILGYENNDWRYVFLVPAIFFLTIWVAIKKMIFGSNLKVNSFWFDGSSPLCRGVKENAASWKALDIIYNYKPGQKNNFEGRTTDFWNQLKNIKALRNRLKLVKQKLREEIDFLLKKESEIRIFSIASGSAEAVIDIIKEYKEKGVIIKAILLDLDPTAIENSKKLATRAGVINHITFANKSTRALEEVAKEFNPNIIELVGFLEYRPKEKAIQLIRRIYSLLAPNGVFFTSTVTPSFEKMFSYYVSNWPMIYRNLDQFIDLVVDGGFDPRESRIIYEPLKVQKIAICRKVI